MLYSTTCSSSLALAGVRRQRLLNVSRFNAVVRSHVRHVTHRNSQLRLVSPVAAAAPTDEQPAAAAAGAAAEIAEEQPLPVPSSYHMPQLTGKERAALRAQSEGLAKAKTLQRLQIGAQGITFNVLVSV